jgi:hypothetical protein
MLLNSCSCYSSSVECRFAEAVKLHRNTPHISELQHRNGIFFILVSIQCSLNENQGLGGGNANAATVAAKIPLMSTNDNGKRSCEFNNSRAAN